MATATTHTEVIQSLDLRISDLSTALHSAKKEVLDLKYAHTEAKRTIETLQARADVSRAEAAAAVSRYSDCDARLQASRSAVNTLERGVLTLRARHATEVDTLKLAAAVSDGLHRESAAARDAAQEDAALVRRAAAAREVELQAAHESALRVMSAQHEAVRAQLELQFASDLRVLKQAARAQAEPAQRERATRTATRTAAAAKSDLSAALDAADRLQHELLLAREENAQLRLAFEERGATLARAGLNDAGGPSDDAAASAVAAAHAQQHAQVLVGEIEALRGKFRQLATVSKTEVERLRSLVQHLSGLALASGVDAAALVPAHLAPAAVTAVPAPVSAPAPTPAPALVPAPAAAAAAAASPLPSSRGSSGSTYMPPTPYTALEPTSARGPGSAGYGVGAGGRVPAGSLPVGEALHRAQHAQSTPYATSSPSYTRTIAGSLPSAAATAVGVGAGAGISRPTTPLSRRGHSAGGFAPATPRGSAGAPMTPRAALGTGTAAGTPRSGAGSRAASPLQSARDRARIAADARSRATAPGGRPLTTF